jgi:hypothetical protein
MISFRLSSYYKFFKFYLINFLYNKKNDIIYKNNKETILYFLPEAGLDEYLKIQIKISKYLKKLNYNVVLVRCQRVFNKCQLKNSSRLNYGLKNKIFGNLICEVCLAKSITNLDKLNFSIINLYNDKDSVNIKDIKDEYFKSDNIIKFIRYKYCGVKVAKLALYDFLLETKKKNLKDINPNEISELRLYTISAIRAIEFLKKIKQNSDFKYIFLRDEFSMMSAVNLWCRINKIKVFRVEGAYLFNHSLKYISFLKSKSVYEERAYLVKNWPYFKNFFLKKEIIKDLYNDLIFRMTTSGGHIFSSNYDKCLGKKIFKILNVENNKKILVLYTSSDDEMKAGSINAQVFKLNSNKIDIFNSQLDWIKKTIEYVENKTSKFQLIIRIHPRSSSNSEEMKIYKNYFDDKKFDNVRVIYPEEKISSFNLAEIADLALVSWSSIALELTRLCVPVLSGYQSNAYIIPIENSSNFTFAKDEQDYFKKINSMTHESPSILETIKNLRWCSYLYLGNTINLKNFYHNYNNIYKSKNTNIIKRLLKNNTCIIEEVLKENHNKNIYNKNNYQEQKYVLENLKKLSSFFNNFSNSRLQQRIKYITKDEL